MKAFFWINFCAGVFFAFWILIMAVVVLLYWMNLQAEIATESELRTALIFTAYLIVLSAGLGWVAWLARRRSLGVWPAQAAVVALLGGGLWTLYGYV